MIRTCLAFIAAAILITTDAFALDVSSMRRLAVQHDGRLKPFDTYARAQMRFIHGRERVAGEDPVETVLSIAFENETWRAYPLFDVPHIPLLVALGFPKEQKRLSPAAVEENADVLGTLISGGRGRRLAEAAAELGARASAYDSIMRLESTLPIVPPTSADAAASGDAAASEDAEVLWMPLATATGHSVEDMEAVRSAFRSLKEAFVAGNQAAFDNATAELIERLRALNPDAYPSEGRLARETHYNSLKPFRAAWILYILAFLLALASLWSKHRVLYVALIAALGLSLAVHTYGLVLRTLVAGRAPLTNMYESLVLMSWGVAAFGIIFEMKYRLRYAALVASFLGIITIAIAQRLNVEIRPAIAVLRSVWLSYHVLTVMLGYSAFAVALGAGHIVVGRYALAAPGSRSPDRLNDFVYRVLQVGVLFLAAGIITGSIWANYSWGRYWGWDPKETWSLITLLGYLVVLHARHQGWLTGFGMGVASILCFLLVMMTYYGVNYILRGLHSYASDGPRRIPAWLIAYILIELAYVGAAAILANARRTKRESLAGKPPE